jgi:2-polyprenyl-3-methyl-5-hydroxy-6-metoxy-1,4-benzoquinol methylase
MSNVQHSSIFNATPIAAVQEYWNRRPCNIRHSPASVGTKEYFDQVEWRKYFVEPHIPAFAQFDRWKGKKVLEIGCGIGTDTISFARAGALVTTVDLSEESLAVARKRAEVFGLSDRVRFHHANAEQLSDTVPVQPYDLIYSFGVIHHTPHPGRILDELKKYCHAGTELRIMVYNRNSWKVFWILLTEGKLQFWKLDRLIADHSEAQTGCPVTYAYSAASGREWLERSGYQVTGVAIDHIFPYKISEYVQYRYRYVWYFRWLPKSVFRWLERHWGWHLCLTARPSA